MRFLLTLIVFCFGTTTSAHEFWISPVNYTIESGTEIVADIRVGQDFSGSAYSYIPRTFARFDTIGNGETTAVLGQLGDRPALRVTAKSGLNIIAHETTRETLKYNEWEKFQSFIDHKDLGVTRDAHLARGLPDAGFTEEYIRFAKSLVQVGDGIGQDIETGMKTEIVALLNPYTDDLSSGFPVRVLRDGAPRRDAQVEIFAREGHTVITTIMRTDDTGIAVVPVTSGTEYLIDAVYLEPVTESDAVWASFWASLTFETP